MIITETHFSPLSFCGFVHNRFFNISVCLDVLCLLWFDLYFVCYKWQVNEKEITQKPNTIFLHYLNRWEYLSFFTLLETKLLQSQSNILPSPTIQDDGTTCYSRLADCFFLPIHMLLPRGLQGSNVRKLYSNNIDGFL